MRVKEVLAVKPGRNGKYVASNDRWSLNTDKLNDSKNVGFLGSERVVS